MGSAMTSLMPCSCELAVELADGLAAAVVDVGDGGGVEAEPARRVGGGGERAGLLEEQVGVGVVEAAGEAVDDEAGQAAGVGLGRRRRASCRSAPGWSTAVPGRYERRRWSMIEATMASTMPCSTPTTTTVTATSVATTNSSGRRRSTLRMPAMSTSSMPMRNTTDDSTALGMYWIGTVRNSSTIGHDDAGGDLGELAAAAGAVDHLGLGRAAVDDEGAGDAGHGAGGAEPDEVDVLVEVRRCTSRRRPATWRRSGPGPGRRSTRRCP